MDDYILATGETHTVREFCEAAFAHFSLDWEEYVVVDPEVFRPVDRQAPVGDASKARERLGWRPKTAFPELVAMMVDADVATLPLKERNGAAESC